MIETKAKKPVEKAEVSALGDSYESEEEEAEEEEEEESEEEYESEVEMAFSKSEIEESKDKDAEPKKSKNSKRSAQKSSSRRKLGKSKGVGNLGEETKDNGWAQMNESIRAATGALEQNAS